MRSRHTLVGRRREVAAVRAALRTPGRVLVLVGDAGIGKTRLLDEAADGLPGDVRVLAGRCLPLSVDLPLLPILDVLRALLAVEHGHLVDAALRRCPVFVRDELTRLLPELGPEPAGDAQRQRQFEAIRRVLAEARPAAVVIDDLQWSDNASLDLLEYLIGRPGAPAIVLAVRPATDVNDRVQRWLTRIMRLPVAARFDLAPLGAQDVAAMLETLGWTGTATGAAGIATRSGGIPYYVEQLAAIDVGEVVPEGLQTLLRERLTGLSGSALDLLRVLSVAGRPVTDDETHAACGAGAGDALRELAERGLVETTESAAGSTRRAPGHALLAEAVRAQLTAEETRSVHARVAAAFAAQPDVDADDVARHLARAGDAAGEAAWRVRAADHARRRAAPREAYGHLARAIAVDPALDVGVHLQCYDLARHAGDTDGAWSLAERMLVRFEADSPAEIRMRLWNAVGHHQALRDSAGLEGLRRAVEIGRSAPRTAAYGYVLYDLERHLRGHGRFAESRAVATELADVARRCGDPELSALADVELACHALLAEDVAGGFAALARAERGSAQAIGQGLNAAAMITDLLLLTGRLTETVDYGRRLIEEREAAGLSEASVTGSLRADVAAALLEQGRRDEAESVLGPTGDHQPAPDAAASADVRSVVDVARGRAADAVRYWNATAPLPANPLLMTQAAPHLLTALVEAGSLVDAVNRGTDVLRLVLTCDQSRFAGRTIMLVRRALGDLIEAGSAPEDVRKHSDEIDELLAAAPVDPFAPRSYPVTSAAAGATDRAEKSRVEGRSDPPLWWAAAEAWRELGRPWRSAYCQWRGAQAELTARGSRAAAVAGLRQAWTNAAGNIGLQAAIADLARAARIDLSEPVAPASRPAELLTERELAVLRLVADGRTNAEIGRELYISPKTISVHVTHIMRKLGARSRVDAATRAQRAGLLG